MPDPVTITAATGWGISAAGWFVSPIISRILNKGIDLLDINAPERLKILDIQVLQLQRLMEVADESTYRARLEPLINKLKSAIYEAEDILDSVEYVSLEKKIQDAKSDGTKMDFLEKLESAMPSNPLTDKDGGLPKLELEESLNKIENAISDACKLLEKLKLPSVSSDNGIQAVGTNSRSTVTTGSPPLQVIGRDQDRDNIIAMLHEKEDQCQANTVSGKSYSIIGIHGIAGSGKSTLAQCVYDHEKKYKEEKMEGHFDLVMWIHVSQKFDLDSIFRAMYEGATRVKCPKFTSRNVLKENLEEKLHGKSILLVLDDVWCNRRNARDSEELRHILPLLNTGKAGNRILLTSRTEDASVALGAVQERRIPISDLDDKVFLELFMSYALPDVRAGGQDRRKLEVIGEDIAKKLKRSPLAARIVGSRLGLQQNVNFWRREKNRNLMSETMGALWWSYQYFDEQVRRCFSYCSIFPRGYHLNRDELVKLWVAEGFIKTSMPEEEMEDVAQYYFDELVSASFMHLGGKEWSREAYSFGREYDYFTIHDLLCDLAEEVAGRDCFRIEEGWKGEVPQDDLQDVRYLFVGIYDREMLTKKMPELQNLRTLIFADMIPVNCEDLESMLGMLTGLRKLRVLKLRFSIDSGNTFSLTDSIGQWKHLRYFALPWFTSKLILPGTFTKLYHMQFVDFGRSYGLVFSSGDDLINLVNLRHLISMVDLKFQNMGRLTRLQNLTHFTIRTEQGYEPHQLKHLNKLQGMLQIHGLENVKSKGEALEVNLAGKEKLTDLVLCWDKPSGSPEVEAEVLEGLCPSKYLERLEIWRYNGMTLPNWMMGQHNGGPKNLEELAFSGWRQPGLAPDLAAFVHLHSLCIWECSWDCLPGMEHLTSLKQLRIYHCVNMRSLGTLPNSLEVFVVRHCNPELEQLCNDRWPKPLVQAELDILLEDMNHIMHLHLRELISCTYTYGS